MLNLFSFIHFLNIFGSKYTRKIRVPIWGDEYMMGNWTVKHFDFASNSIIDTYNIYLMPHENQDALIGNISITTETKKKLYDLILRFKGDNRDGFSLRYKTEDGTEKELTYVQFQYDDGLLLNAFGSIQSLKLSYGATMLSDLNMDLILFDKSSGVSSIYKLSKPRLKPPGGHMSNSWISTMLVFYLIYKQFKPRSQDSQNE